MAEFSKTFEVIWADIDPNHHMRHTAYNDYAAQCRVAIFQHFGLPLEKLARLGLGPILFREETLFRKEVHLSEQITVTCEIARMRKDGSKWSIRHKIFKENGEEAAIITVDGAWLDLKQRKTGVPPEELQKIINDFPRTKDFEWIPDKVML